MGDGGFMFCAGVTRVFINNEVAVHLPDSHVRSNITSTLAAVNRSDEGTYSRACRNTLFTWPSLSRDWHIVHWCLFWRGIPRYDAFFWYDTPIDVLVGSSMNL